MTLTQEQFELLTDIVSDIDGARLTSYSGRGMFGKECVAVYGDDAFALGMAIGQEEYLASAFDGKITRQDSMGLGIVIYWPQIQMPSAGMSTSSASIMERA